MRCLLLLVLVLLAGCASETKKYETPNEVILLSRAISASSTYATSAASPPPRVMGEEFILASDYLYNDIEIKDTSMSFFLFPKKPVGAKAKDKMLLICEEWKANFPSIYDLKQTVKDVEIVPFYWLLNKRNKKFNCNDLIENYDYAKSQQMARSLKLGNTKQYIVLKHRDHIVTMDISRLDKPEDLSLSIETWKSKLTKFPKGNNVLTVVDFTYSAKAVLGALGTLIAMK